MSTYLEMQDRIAYEVRAQSSAASSGIEAPIQRAILSAIKFYERRRFYFNTRLTDTFALVANQEYYGSSDLAAIPNLITIDDMYVTVDSIRYHVTPAPFSIIAGAQDGLLTRDPPYRYAYHAQQIRMFPIPAAARTATMATHYRLTALSSGSDTNAWTDDAEELIRNHAEADLWSMILREEDMAAICQQRAQMALSALQRETKLRRNVRELELPGEIVGYRQSDIRVGP